MKFLGLLSALSLSSSFAASDDVLNLWSIRNVAGRRLTLEEPRNRRLDSVRQKFFFDFVPGKLDSFEDGMTVSFDIPHNGEIQTKECVMKRGNILVPEELAVKFPEILLLSGSCPNGEEVQMSIDKTREDGMSATFFKASRRFSYVDSAAVGTNEYVIYDYADVMAEGERPAFESEGVILTPASEIPKVSAEVLEARKAKRRASSEAFQFKLACVANKEYSNFHGNTKSLVMQALITLWTRVNGVYMHEFGSFFTFVSNQDAAICLLNSGDAQCNALPNSGNIINQVSTFLANKGIPYASYDVGHSVTTGSGGLAAYPALCTSGSKASATTGLPQPINDPFAIDYVAHEMGHQFLGAHSFRDCAGPNDGNLMIEGAVEPGSASSIMGYAGICEGDKNIQAHSDPYFNNLNQQQMYDYILSVQQDGSCGTSFAVGNVVPVVTAQTSCQVPVGNNFQLKGNTQTSPVDNSFYSWDRVDNSIEDFDSLTLGKFRSWKPTPSTKRFFPNLFFLNYPNAEPTNDVERLPSNARTMKFRFTERTLYQSDITAPSFNVGQAGAFDFADTTVTFRSLAPMRMTNPPANGQIFAESANTFTWSAGGAASLQTEVSFFVAINTFSEVSSSVFDYEVHNHELDWVLIGTANIAAGTASFTVPRLNADNSVEVNVMMRSGSDECFFFELATKVTLVQTGATQPPVTVPPVPAPTVGPAPTTGPVPTPSPIPATNPTSPPVTSPTVPAPTAKPTSQFGLDQNVVVFAVAGLALAIVATSLGLIVFVLYKRSAIKNSGAPVQEAQLVNNGGTINPMAREEV